jgi:prepilin-type N-terminal cleavage/methylation domain-containing protein
MTKNGKGFSLIELLIVVAIILIIAAIAIPNLLRSRMAANEASAVGSIRTMNTAAITFNSTYGIGYPPTLASIGTTGTTASCTNAELIDSVLTTGAKSGYNFALVAGTVAVPSASVPTGCTGGKSDGYVVTAVPQNPGTTGQRGFCSDETGVIRYNVSSTAGYTSPLCTVAQNPLQ